MRLATSCMLARNSPGGNSTTRNVMSALHDELAVHSLISADGHGEARALVDRSWPQTSSVCAGVTKVRSLTSFSAARNGMRWKLGARDDQPARGLRHGFDQQHARHQRVAREMALEDRAGGGDDRLGADRQFGKIKCGDPVDKLEILDPHWAPDITFPWRRPDRRCGRTGSSARNTARWWPCRR